MWRHEVYWHGKLVALDYSSGAFLNRAGHPRLLPEAMREALMKGDAPAVL